MGDLGFDPWFEAHAEASVDYRMFAANIVTAGMRELDLPGADEGAAQVFADIQIAGMAFAMKKDAAPDKIDITSLGTDAVLLKWLL